MFDKFGEFGSAEELNKAAEGFKNEGDIKSLYELAEENGISKEDVADYMDGYVDKFASEMMAALGRMEVEKKELEKENDTITKSAVHYILLFMDAMLSDPEMQKAIMEKGKSPKKLLEKMKNTARKHAEGNTGVCCGTDKELKDLIKIYYTQSEDELKKKLDSLYK